MRWVGCKLALQTDAISLQVDGTFVWNVGVVSKDPFRLRDRLEVRLAELKNDSLGSLVRGMESLAVNKPDSKIERREGQVSECESWMYTNHSV